MTYRQAQALGGQVRDGERSQFAIFYKSYTKSVESPVRPGEALDEQRRVLRSYAVFSADQIDGLAADYHPAAVELVHMGTASCRERVCQSVYISWVAVSIK